MLVMRIIMCARRVPTQKSSHIKAFVSEFEKKLHTKRIQVRQQHHFIRELQNEGFSTVSAEMLLDRMLERIDKLCAELERLQMNRARPIRTYPLRGSSPDGCGS
jgi:predicted ATP-dependent endonuclease of OLD family